MKKLKKLGMSKPTLQEVAATLFIVHNYEYENEHERDEEDKYQEWLGVVRNHWIFLRPNLTEDELVELTNGIENKVSKKVYDDLTLHPAFYTMFRVEKEVRN